MKLLYCEKCNGNDFIKDGDLLICQNCGAKYYLENLDPTFENTFNTKSSLNEKDITPVSFVDEIKNVVSDDMPIEFIGEFEKIVIEEAQSVCNSIKRELKNAAREEKFQIIDNQKCVKINSYNTLRNNNYTESGRSPLGFKNYWRNDAKKTIVDKYQLKVFDFDMFNVYLPIFIVEEKREKKDRLFGEKVKYDFYIHKSKYTDLFFNTLRDLLEADGISYSFSLTFFIEANSRSIPLEALRSYDITNDFPEIHEHFTCDLRVTSDISQKICYKTVINASVPIS